jgi:hypothetical protein
MTNVIDFASKKAKRDATLEGSWTYLKKNGHPPLTIPLSQLDEDIQFELETEAFFKDLKRRERKRLLKAISIILGFTTLAVLSLFGSMFLMKNINPLITNFIMSF